ncbi:MAG TPA: hypothetical protein PLD73_11585 [Candidatus Hydrogenedentes bacterium]|nr:hypothetical protein [Candidatus Hydrogenedentota bacterium]
MSKRKSSRTFSAEYERLRNIDGVFWGNEDDYLQSERDPFGALREPRQAEVLAPGDRRYPEEGYQHIPDTEYVFGDSGVRVYEAARKSDEALAEVLYETLGIDARQLGEGNSRLLNLANLTERFGTEAFGAYLPWHAFAKSRRTPWGMYLFLDLLLAWAASLYDKWPASKPTFLYVLRLVIQIVYRHELFHYHVERFSTRHEIMIRQPVYRPYTEKVIPAVARTEHWLEEALAQAVVLNSRLVTNRAGMQIAALQKLLVPEFKCFPAGYCHFECLAYGGPDIAHRVFASQILTATTSRESFVTDIAVPKTEYSDDDKKVPGYLAWRPDVFSRFQLATPKVNRFWRFANRNNVTTVRQGPGDHQVLEVGGERFQLNVINGHVDKASLKKLAKIRNCSVFSLIQAINAC